MKIENIIDTIRDYKDYPKKGILFKDISPILKDPDKIKFIIKEMSNSIKLMNPDVIVAPDARGFIFAIPIALELNLPFVMVRKKGKLPGDLYSEDYELEYGKTTLQIQKEAIGKNKRVVIIDDIIATGGTSKAIESLIKKSNSIIAGHAYLMSILNIDYKDILEGQFYSMIKI
ncbi:MAG: adenine phosphoribosyltransferase [Mycoplasmoidaceae bacterium]